MQENRRRKTNTAVIAESDSRDVTEEKLDGFEEEEIVKEPTKTRAGVWSEDCSFVSDLHCIPPGPARKFSMEEMVRRESIQGTFRLVSSHNYDLFLQSVGCGPLSLNMVMRSASVISILRVTLLRTTNYSNSGITFRLLTSTGGSVVRPPSRRGRWRGTPPAAGRWSSTSFLKESQRKCSIFSCLTSIICDGLVWAGGWLGPEKSDEHSPLGQVSEQPQTGPVGFQGSGEVVRIKNKINKSQSSLSRLIQFVVSICFRSSTRTERWSSGWRRTILTFWWWPTCWPRPGSGPHGGWEELVAGLAPPSRGDTASSELYLATQ